MTTFGPVPPLSMFFMIVTLLICLFLFLGLFLILRKKMGLKVMPLLVGVATFILFALILESMIHRIVLNPQADGTNNLSGSPVLFVLYACMMAGIFEETGRFVAFKLLRRKYQGIQTAISYGIGHGGGEAMLLAGLTAVSNLAFALMLNMGLTEMLGDMAEVQATATVLVEMPPVMFLVGGIERIAAVTLHICLSVLVWHSVNSRGKFWFYPLAILLHACFNAPAAMYQVGVISSLFVVELLLYVEVAALVYLVWRLHGKVGTVVDEIQDCGSSPQ